MQSIKTSEKYDLAILELETPYPDEFSIKAKNFEFLNLVMMLLVLAIQV